MFFRKKTKRFVTVLLAAVMVLNSIPAAFAAETGAVSDGISAEYAEYTDSQDAGQWENTEAESVLQAEDAGKGTDDEGSVTTAEEAVQEDVCEEISAVEIVTEETNEAEDPAGNASAGGAVPALLSAPIPDLGTGKGILYVKLKDFIPTGKYSDETYIPQDVVIFDAEDPSAEQPEIEWEPVNYYAYSLNISADFVKENLTDDRLINIELAPGFRFNYDTADQIRDLNSAFESVEWIRYPEEGYNGDFGTVNKELRDEYGFEPRGGKVTIKVKGNNLSNIYTVDFSLLILPEKQLFNYQQCLNGYEVENAVQVTVSQGNEVLGKGDVSQDIAIRADRNDYPHRRGTEKGLYCTGKGSSGYNQNKCNAEPGETFTLVSSVAVTNFAITDDKKAAGAVMKLLSLTVRADSPDLNLRSSTFTLTPESPEKKQEGGKEWWYYTFTKKNFGPEYMGYNLVGIDLKYTVPAAASEGTVYKLQPVAVEEQWWNEAESTTTDPKAGTMTVTVLAPGSCEVSLLNAIARGEGTKIYFQQGIVSGEEYITSISGVVLRKSGTGDPGAMIYEADFPTDKMFIDGAGIPFSAAGGADSYPTEIVFTDENGAEYIIRQETGETAEEYMSRLDGMALVRDKTSKSSDGFIIMTDRIPEYPEGVSLAHLRVELPCYAYQRVNGGYTYDYGSGYYLNCCVFGHPLEGAEGTYQVKFSLESDKETPAFKKIEKTVTNEIAYYGKMNGDYQGNGAVHHQRARLSVSGSTELRPGDTLNVNVSNWGRNIWLIGDEDKCFKPVMWVPVPAGLELNQNNSAFVYNSGSGKINVTSVYTEVTEAAKNLEPGWRLYELSFNEDEVTFIGGMDKDEVSRSLDGNIQFQVLPSAKPLEFALEDYFFTGSGLRGVAMYNQSTGDSAYEYDPANGRIGRGCGYGLSGASQVARVSASIDILISANPDIAVVASFKKENGTEWIKYDGASDGTVLASGEKMQARISIQNLMDSPAKTLEVYIPVPKTDMAAVMQERYEDFFSDCGFDMFVTKAEAGEMFSVKYAQVTKPSEIKESGVISPESGWTDTPDKNTNFIRISLLNGEQHPLSKTDGEQYIIVDFDITEDERQNDSRNKWKTSYTVETAAAGGSYHYLASNFGCLLQNGVITGTIYIDGDGNGQKAASENGVPNVKITAKDIDGNTYSSVTDQDGKYTINGLPGKKEFTVTVLNPGSINPAAAGSKRFTKYSKSSDAVTGCDVTPNETGTSAAAVIEKLSDLDGKAVINAGFIVPLKHEFKIKEGDSASISPTYVMAYAGQSLKEATETLSPKLPKVTLTNDEDKHTGWIVNGEKLSDTELLAKCFDTAQTVTAQIRKAGSVTVVPSDSIVYDGKPVSAGKAQSCDIRYDYTGDGTVSCTYYLMDGTRKLTTPANSGASSQGGAPVWAGNYQIRVKVSETEVYGGADSGYVGFTIKKAQVGTATVSVTAPVKGQTPSGTAAVTESEAAAGTAAWNPGDAKFRGAVAYTVSVPVSLTDAKNHTFADSVTATVNGNEAVFANGKVSYTFAKLPDKTIGSIRVKEEPRTEYTYGDAFDPAGLVITVNYDDGTSEEVSYRDEVKDQFTFAPAELKAGTESVTITYGGKSTSQKITVAKAKISTVTVSVTAPVKGEIPSGTAAVTESEAAAGTAAWNPGDAKFRGAVAYMVSIPVSIKDTANYEFAGSVTATVNGNEAAFANGKVSYTFAKLPDKTIGSIRVKEEPRTEYTYGDAFDPAGLVITVNYDDGTSEEVSYRDEVKDQFTFAPAELKAGTESVTITYGGKSTGQKITVAKAKISTVTVSVTAPVKGQTPSGTAAVTESEAAAGTAAWNPGDAKFRGAVAYTVSIPVSIKDTANYEFAGSVAATVNGNEAAFANGKVSYTFAKLPAPDPSGGGSTTVTWMEYSCPVKNPIVSNGNWKIVPPTVNSWTYTGTSGQRPKDCWLYLRNGYSKSGKTYGWFRFDGNGIMMTGWIPELNGCWYYLHDIEDGDYGSMETGWHYDKDDGRTYYLRPEDGAMVSGSCQIDGKNYYFNTATEMPSWICREGTGTVTPKKWVYRSLEGVIPLGALID